MTIKTSKMEMKQHSFFADLINQKPNETKSFIPWLVHKAGESWKSQNFVIDFSKIHISPVILEVWKRETEKRKDLPDLDLVPGIQLMKKDMNGFKIRVDKDFIVYTGDVCGFFGKVQVTPNGYKI